MTNVRAIGQEAFVLHLRPYRETSAIVELMTLEHGRVSVVARGVRGRKRKGAETLIPFVRMLVGWSGRGELRTLTAFEPTEHHWLVGKSLYAGLYLNELMLRLLRSDDPHAELFRGYALTVCALAGEAPSALAGEAPSHTPIDTLIEKTLRRFEKLLLKECGYELVFDRDADTGERVSAQARYFLEPDFGFRRLAAGKDGLRSYRGATLLAIAADHFDEIEVRRVAKRIMREALAPHLGNRPLHSRSLFRASR
ncbi:MAG: DNA repair protein RecO [Gammaproteobacteria bacterium]|nr:DNA repair protein RecO [Gammaproteobacteria bacterium]